MRQTFSRNGSDKFFFKLIFFRGEVMRIFIAIHPEDAEQATLVINAEYSPNIEVMSSGEVVFDLTQNQIDDIHGLVRDILERIPASAIAVSPNAATSLLLLRKRGGVSMHGVGGRDDLKSIGIEGLGAGRDFTRLMRDWAIDDLDAFSALPEDEMVERFGASVKDLFDRSRGSEFRPIASAVGSVDFRWRMSFDSPITGVESLRFTFSTAVRHIFERLSRRCLGASECIIDLSDRGKTKRYEVKSVVPTMNEKVWMRLVSVRIESEPPGFDISSVSVEFIPAKLRTIQSNLFSANVLEPEKIGLVVSKIEKMVGRGNIGIPKIADSWKPRDFDIDSDLSGIERTTEMPTTADDFPSRVFFYFPSPVRVKIFFDGRIPSRMVLGGRSVKVISASGPWRVDGGWWRDDAWHRDEWDLETEDGSLFRMFSDEHGGFFLEGGYD
jgi:protein ImuB